MDNDLQELEAELKALRPVAPSAEFVCRVQTQLSAAPVSPSRLRSSLRWIWWVALPAAAAVAFLVGQRSHRSEDVSGEILTREGSVRRLKTPETEGSPRLKPVAAENVLVSASDEGLVTLEDGTPARRERLHYVDTITWKNPGSNTSLRWSVPREEVRVVPVSFQ